MPELTQILKRQQVLADFGNFAMSSQDLNEILTEACRLVAIALEAPCSKILEIQKAERCLLVRAGVGWATDIVGQVRLSMDEGSSETFAINAKKPVISQDVSKDERFDICHFMKETGIVALVNVPIFLPGGCAYGLLQVDDTRARDFDHEDTEFLCACANILGPVVHRLIKVDDLRASEERFRSLINATSYAVYRMSPDWTKMRQLDGQGFLSDTRHASMTWLMEYIRQDDQPHVWNAIQEAIRTRSPFELEHRVKRADGSDGWTLSRAVPLIDNDGKIFEWFGTASDVTTRRKTEEALCESEARQRALIEGLPQLVWKAIGQGNWSWASPQWLAYTGQTMEEACGFGWIDALHPGDRASARRNWEEAEVNGLYQADFRIQHKSSGLFHWFQIQGLPIHGDTGAITEWTGTCTDINDQMQAREALTRDSELLEAMVIKRTTELREAVITLQTQVRERERAEECLRQSEKLKAIGQLTGGIAHDFNNMLQGVTSSLGMIRRRIEQNRSADAAGYIDTAEKATNRAAALTHRLLAFGRQQTLKLTEVNLDAIARDMEDMIRRTVGSLVQVDLKLANGAWLVMCDISQMESALLNLCINARDAMPAGGWLTISTANVELSQGDVQASEGALPGKYSSIAVTDTGTGMLPDVMAKVFEPFFTTKPLGKGTGLGLSQIYEFVRQSNGIVHVDSKIGEGTTIRLCLPLYRQNPTAAAMFFFEHC